MLMNILRLFAYFISAIGGSLLVSGYQQSSMLLLGVGAICVVLCFSILLLVNIYKQEVEIHNAAPLLKTTGVCIGSALLMVALVSILKPEYSHLALVLAPCLVTASVMGALLMEAFSRKEAIEGDRTSKAGA
jgi:FlaA1/EpsC-like NDP-sugar epimerase